MVPTSPLSASASAIGTYRTCAYRYALEHVRKLPMSERLMIPALAFGDAVHKALAQFTRTGGHAKRGFGDLVALLHRNWRPEAFGELAISAAELERATEMLEAFYFNPYPEHVEHSVAVEEFVRWRKARRGIEAIGKMDRVCLLPGRVLEVIDYKTGRTTPSPAEAEAELQTVFYGTLAADVYRHLEPAAIQISYVYLVGPTVVTVKPPPEAQLARWAGVEATVALIRRDRATYAAGAELEQAFTPNRGSACRGCAMRLHCDVRFPMPAANPRPPSGPDQRAMAG